MGTCKLSGGNILFGISKHECLAKGGEWRERLVMPPQANRLLKLLCAYMVGDQVCFGTLKKCINDKGQLIGLMAPKRNSKKLGKAIGKAKRKTPAKTNSGR
jgi:hypothetical protein